MTLNATSISWAIDFVSNHSDGDLFPKVMEIEAIGACRDDFIRLLEGKDLSNFSPGAHRRFIVPKDEISYRQATQLDPQDSILLSAVIHQFGQGIEDRRLAADIVFGYRFSPNAQQGLYGSQTAWNDFWTAAYYRSFRCSTVLYCDIADFYNQIYHHTVENQLMASAFPNQAIKWIINLLESTTAGVSRGVPIGPHGIHLIAEATLIPVDNSMVSTGLSFLRYADDILVYCNSEKASRQALASIASTLDKQQRLMLQQHKTKFFEPEKFRALCQEMIEDRPISSDEDKVLKLIRRYSGGDPYRNISYNDISVEDWKAITEDIVRGIIEAYINKDQVDYIRLRWFYRRLSQIGHPGAIDVSISEIERLGPCFANICSYLASVQAVDPERWKTIGSALLRLLDADEVRGNEFFRLSILSLFSRNAHIDHFTALASRFQTSDPYARREIFLSAKQNGAFDWLREHKENYQNMDPWQKMAFVFCASGFPPDERKYFIGRWHFDRPFETVLAKWAKSPNNSLEGMP